MVLTIRSSKWVWFVTDGILLPPIPTRARAKHNGKEMDFFCLTHEGTYISNKLDSTVQILLFNDMRLKAGT